MDEWEEYYKKPGDNSQAFNNYLQYAHNKDKHYSRENIVPDTFGECFVETDAAFKLNKWNKIVKIAGIILFVLMILGGLGNAITDAYESHSHYQLDEFGNISPLYVNSYTFNIRKFIVALLSCLIAAVIELFVVMLASASLNCVAQITRDTAIRAKLAAFNTKKQMIKDYKKEKEN